MWGFIIGAAVLVGGFAILLALAMCNVSAAADKQACAELAELLRKRDCRGNNSPGTPVE